MPSSRLLALLLAGLVACKGGADNASSGDPVVRPSNELIPTAAAPAGLAFAPHVQSHGTLEVPTGKGWELVDNQVEGADGTVIMLQAQSGIGTDQMNDYLASYIDEQKRDAPKYANGATTKGTISGVPAARVQGTFDNGTKFVTRDYVLFTKHGVVMIGGRTPAPNAAQLDGLVDYMAHSYKSK